MLILEDLQGCRRTLGILVDPEKLDESGFSAFAKAMSTSIPRLTTALELDQIVFLIGGSTMTGVDLEEWILQFRKTTDLTLILFPGSHLQISDKADGLFFLNLISGRNPQYLIGEQVLAAGKLKSSTLEIIPTGYILVDGGVETAVARISNTKPILQDEQQLIIDTAFAGQLMGNRLIYLEAGSGALDPVTSRIVSRVVAAVNIPVITGGGLRDIPSIKERFLAGAKMVVVGTAIEQDFNWNG